MENYQKNIDDLFREELGSYTETPPPAAWDALEKKLATRSGGGGVPNRRIWYAALLGLLLLLSVPAVIYFTGSNTNSDSNLAISTNTGSNSKPTAGPDAANQGATAAVSEPNIDRIGSESATDAGNEDDENKNANSNTIANTENRANETGDISNNTKQNKQTASKKNKQSTIHTTAAIAGNTKNDKTGETIPQQQNIYNSKLTNPAPADEADEDENTDNTKPAPKPEKNNQLAKTNSTTKSKIKEPAKSKPKVVFNKYELGIKAGIERGFDNDAARKFTASAYLQYNISSKFSIMLQPTFKVAKLDSRRIGDASGYYKENNDSVMFVSDPTTPVISGPDGNPVLNLTKYKYAQSHDSIVKSNSIGGTYFEAELPVLVKFYITDDFSVYGGVNFVYSQSTSIHENTFITRYLIDSGQANVFSRIDQEPVPPPVNSIITHAGTPYSEYQSLPNTTQSTINAGYMVGFSYEFSKRWLVDGLLQQTTAKPNMQSGYNINTTQSAPYVRFTLGYKLLKK